MQVNIGDSVLVDKAQWAAVLTQKEDSMFLKEGMVAIWSSAVLRNRTVTGTLSNKAKARGQTHVAPALTPKKLDVLKGVLPP